MTTILSREAGAAAAAERAPAGRSAALELGLGIIVVGVPLAFLPMSSGPFLNLKLLLLLVAIVAVWHGLPRTRALGVPAMVWIAAAAVAGLAGVDRWLSVTGPENSGTGLVFLGACAFLLVAGTAVPGRLRARIPVWLTGMCTAVALLALVDRFLPDALAGLAMDLSFDGSTLGDPVFVAALMAAGIATAIGLERVEPARLVPMLVLMSSALALSTKRVGWVALAVGIGVALWRIRPQRRRALLVLGTVAITLMTWTAIDAFATVGRPLSGAGRFSQLTSGSAKARVQTFTALGRAWGERPIVGWGPGNTWSAHLSAAKASELRLGERGVGDAHNIVVESAVTTGAVGLAAFLALVGLTIRRMRHGPRSIGWAVGAVAGLGVSHLLQPMSISLTPLLFLLAGMAGASPPEVDGERDDRMRRAPSLRRVGGMLLAAAALGLTGLLLLASMLEAHGVRYGEEWALRAATRLAPQRITAAEALALHLAFDGRAGDTGAAREARDLAAATVRRHPLDPGVRLAAADVHVLLRDPQGAALWKARHRALFGGDPALRDGGRDGPVQYRP